MLLDMMEYFTGKYLNIRKSIGSLVTSIEKFRFLIDKNSYYSTYDELEEIEKKVKKITSSMDTFLEEEKNKENYDEILSNYFELNNFLKISEFFDESFVNLFTSYKNDYIEHSLKCLDTVEIFKNLSIRAVSCVFFQQL